MVAGNALNVPGNGISIPKALTAGAVMALNLKGGQKDTPATPSTASGCRSTPRRC
jgi:hypothetical protein